MLALSKAEVQAQLERLSYFAGPPGTEGAAEEAPEAAQAQGACAHQTPRLDSST